jgi:hypothetical protein
MYSLGFVWARGQPTMTMNKSRTANRGASKQLAFFYNMATMMFLA